MAKTYYISGNVSTSYDTFASWLNKTNMVIYDMSNSVITASSNATPDIVVGNSYVNGFFGCSNHYVTGVLQGGTANVAANLSIGSGVVVSNNIWLTGNATVVGLGANSVISNVATITTGNIVSLSSNSITSNTVGINYLTVGSGNTTNVYANSTFITFNSNSTVNGSINAISYSGTSNNALNLGGSNLAVIQAQITGNAASAYANAYANVSFAQNAAAIGGFSANLANPLDGYLITWSVVQNKLIFSSPNNITTALNSNTIAANLQLQAGSNGTTYVLNAYGNSTLTGVKIQANSVVIGVDSGAVSIIGNETVSGILSVGSATSNVQASGGSVFLYSNSTSAASINSTSYSGTANNSSYLGGTTLSTLQGQITGNAATAYANAVSNLNSFVLSGGYTITGSVTHRSQIAISPTSGSASFVLNNPGTQQSVINFQSGSTTKWQVGMQTDNTYFLYDSTTGLNTIFANTTALALGEGGYVSITANTALLTVANSSGSVSINTTSFSGTANNSSFLGGSSLSTIQSQITGNAASAYANAVANSAALYSRLDGSTAYTGPIKSVYINQVLMKASNGGNDPTLIHRNDGSNYYLLMSNSATTPSESFNGLRPFAINMTNGYLTSLNGQSFGGGTTITGGVSISGGTTTISNGITISGSATAPTPSTGDNSTNIATTAYVKNNLASYLTTSSAASTYLTINNPATITGTITYSGSLATTNPSFYTTATGSSIFGAGSVIVSASQQGGRVYEGSHDFNSYPNLYSAAFVNIGTATNVPSGMSGDGYRFIMGAGDTSSRGFDLVGTNASGLWYRARQNGTWYSVVSTVDSQTLTNKRITNRINSISSASTITPTGDVSDGYKITSLSVATTIAIPSGTPTDQQKLLISIKDNGTSQSISWTTSAGGFRAFNGITLPTATTAGKKTYVGCIYDSDDGFWNVVSVVTQA